MSGLAGLLAGHVEHGVFLWHSHLATADVQHAVEHAGWEFRYLDGVQIENKPEFLAAIGRALDFPDYYGQNLDALADLLGDVGADSQNRGVVVLWDDWGAFARSDESGFTQAMSVLRGRADETRDGIAPFSVLLRGRGPEVAGLTSLD